MLLKSILITVAFLHLFSSNAGIYEPHTLWEKQELVACFYSDESQISDTALVDINGAKERYGFTPKKLSKNKRRRITQAALRDFTPERTGIHFVGFKDCADTSSPDVVIMKAAAKVFLFKAFKWGGIAVIGENGLRSNHQTLGLGYFSKKKQPAFIALKNIIPSIIVHEFGHVAGLRHEHIHSDAQGDSNCHNRRSQLDMSRPELLEQVYATAIIHTEYDSKSIMNYCHITNNMHEINRSNQPILSVKDVSTLKEMYPL